MASAIHVFSRTSKRTGTATAPLEAITRKPQNLEYLRVFGCPAYVHIPSQRRHKMYTPSRKGIFVGYTPNNTAWMVYIPPSRTVISSRPVTFDEDWRPLSALCPFNTLVTGHGGATAQVDSAIPSLTPVDAEVEPFLFKAHPPRRVMDPTIVILPPHPAAAVNKSSVSYTDLVDPQSTSQLAPVHQTISNRLRQNRVSYTASVTRSGRKFRVDAPPLIPSATLHTILEEDNSSSSDDEDQDIGRGPPSSPRKGPVPINRFQAPTPSPSVSAVSSIAPPSDTTAETCPPTTQAQPRHHQR